ncbi:MULTISPECIES: Gfo/Idh/MocA family oxidoreductase [unclassified Arthrobacter]|uniref:Gfo/Idh/MocA family oxidoreductase n=1 Tax=unclassified Arthrobacter TaxID=235627 RepID=UPI00159DA02E|nr:MULTISPECIES: Gfo/Idh/MocA family oxidoreductase [unclassified Arthrobacter]MCQ9165729.1 Gfo/Idh/MocA family oxidoreductase [Arthrobacter sp. STN4]NVN00373.1 Gfo/Idh/MocA family oxidoreductase [Arthrobacter sp. SDTb3-6]
MTYLQPTPAVDSRPVRLGLIGAGWIGAFHAESVARRIPGAVLEAVADPFLDNARGLADRLGVAKVTVDPGDLFTDPAIDGVIIASPVRFHAQLISAAARAGKHVFCEKPAGLDLEELDAALADVGRAGVNFQVGFNRRYAEDFLAAKRDIDSGVVGTPQLLRSLTRDPGTGSIPGAAKTPPWTVFMETLIHDFDTLNWFNAGAEPVQVYAVADALVEPAYKDHGFLDTAVVTIRYDNGAVAVAEASFSALYGYDIRGEVFGSKGMVQAGRSTETAARRYTAAGLSADTPRLNIELFKQAYTDELADFAAGIAGLPEIVGKGTTPGGADARRALATALACIESVRTGAPAGVARPAHVAGA